MRKKLRDFIILSFINYIKKVKNKKRDDNQC